MLPILIANIIFLIILIFRMQDNLLFNIKPDKNIKQHGLPMIDVNYKSIKNLGMYFQQKKPLGVIMIFHGSDRSNNAYIDYIKNIYNWGFSIFMMEYRGYGKRSGKPTESNLYGDAIISYDYITKVLNFPPNKIILYGKSIGSAICIDLAVKKKISSLIIDSGFTNAKEVANIFLPYIGYYICKFKFDNINKIKKVNCPILIIHSEKDPLIPFKMAEELYNNVNNRTEKKIIKTCNDHKNIKWSDLLECKIKYFCISHIKSIAHINESNQ